MLYGLLLWGEHTAGETVRILDAPFFCVTVRRGKTEAATKLRLLWAARLLRRQGVERAVFPRDFPYGEVLEKQGILPVSTLALRCEIAADWADQALRKAGLPLAETKVAVFAERMSPQTVRTVTELSLRHRYVWLSVPRGGEVLGRRLQREYGVSLQLGSGAQAEAAVQFAPCEGQGSAVTLHLWDEREPLPPLVLPPNQEQALPGEVHRGQMIAALRALGAVKHLSVGQM